MRKALILLSLLTLGCANQSGAVDAKERLLSYVQAFGDAAVQLEGTRIVKERYPHLMPLLDVGYVNAEGNVVGSRDGILQLQEILTLDFADPQVAVVVLLIGRAIYAREK